MDAWFLGIDLGTGSCKSVVVDEQAQVRGFGVSEYPAATVEARWKEQDPQAVVTSMVHSARAAIDQAGLPGEACQAISIGAALHSLVALDRSGRPLTGVITWADNRAAPQAQAVRESGQANDLYQQTGCPAHAMYPLYKIIWLRQERPDDFRRASRFVSAKEFVLARLTGRYAVDYSLAAGSGLLNTHDLNWNAASLDLAGITPDQLSPLHSPRTVFHGLDPELAAAMGLPATTPLVLGSSDATNSSVGAGAVLPGQATCMVGTSGALRLIAPRPVVDARARSWCYAIDEGHWLAGGAINNGGIALSWLQDTINSAFPDLAHGLGLSFEDLLALAGRTEAGAGGLLCLPFFAGERSPNWNQNTRGVFFGLTLQHDARHLARALLEGIAFRLRSVYEVLHEVGGDIRQVRASGGFTHSSLWLQIVASALNRDLAVPAWGETSSLGAALWAMLGTGHLASLEDISALIPLGSEYRPIPEQVAAYNRLYRVYAQLYDAVQGAFDQIAGLQPAMG